MKKSILIVLAAAVCSYCTNKVGKLQQSFDKNNQQVVLCDTTNAVISYSTDIAPIIVASCGANNNSCHSSNSSTGILLDFWGGVNYSASTGKFLSSISWDGNASNMPKTGQKLTSCEIKKITKWVNMGAPDN
jgi:hypothetical protein